MRNILCLLLAAAGLAWLAVLLTRRGQRTPHNPTREAERLLDRCRDLLDGIENAARNLEEPGPSPSS